MIYICTATYFEGEAFIKILSLKKDTDLSKFQIFKNDDVTLIITGTGKVRASIAAAYLFSKSDPAESDILINYGICGTPLKNIPLYNTYLCNKILDKSTGRTFYTDILYQHPFYETSIETVDKPLLDCNYENINCSLCDMESSGVYQSAITFMNTDQIYFVKTVSDYLKAENIDMNELKEHLRNESERIINWARELNCFPQNNYDSLTPKEAELIHEISENLKFSEAMKNKFRKELTYYKLNCGKLPDFLYSYKDIECTSKKEGKEYAKAIEEKLI